MDLMLKEYTAAAGTTVVEVSGEIDVYTAPRLREKLISLADAGSYHLIVDMERVEFLDSTGLGVLVGGLKRVRAYDGGIDLVCTQGRILKIFRITGLSKVFDIFDTVDEAVAAHNPGRPGGHLTVVDPETSDAQTSDLKAGNPGTEGKTEGN
ncbi:MAG: STAS domain-containing protein [Streptosporangiaceae bacterium]|nr:STAS domain-containing protein [Streptosporangiaceae bacterium]MBV9855000.1 STAS domain-containing protein [Streptosporangiaceae bacterium]